MLSRQNNPLHISLFPPGERPSLEFSFMLSSSLDIFEQRLPHKMADQDFGLLQAIDERLAMYGYLTNTGVKFVVIVDMEGRPATANDSKNPAAVGLRDSDVKPVGWPLLSGQAQPFRHENLTRPRSSVHYKQHTSTSCGTRFMTRTSTCLQ